jgi:hypothetical protein
MKKEKPFVKGEHVIACTTDKRDRHINMLVVSIGKKYITCKELRGDGDDVYDYPVRFDIDTHVKSDYSSHTLYHTLEDFENEQKAQKMCHELSLSFRYGNFTLEEVLLLKKIRENGLKEVLDEIVTTGVDKWIDKNLTI